MNKRKTGRKYATLGNIRIHIERLRQNHIDPDGEGMLGETDETRTRTISKRDLVDDLRNVRGGQVSCFVVSKRSRPEES